MNNPFRLSAVFPCGLKAECVADVKSVLRMIDDMPQGTVYNVFTLDDYDVTIHFWGGPCHDFG
jgi:hypothetical protein